MDRYHRQTLLPTIGAAGQQRLAAASVLLVGVGALGTVLADYLVRAGVGRVTLADRDVVEATNLQRQTLFAEADVGAPKAVVAMGKLAEVNRDVELVAKVIDVGADNIEELIHNATARAVDSAVAEESTARAVASDSSARSAFSNLLLLDGTDNAATRYLLNDVAVKHGLPWVYGGCVGVDGRVMPVTPGDGPCLRCVFPDAPAAGDMQTCDTAGVLGPAAGVVASLQAAAAIRLLTTGTSEKKLLTIDAWHLRFREIDVSDARRADCPACGQKRFDYLNAAASQAASLCGRDSVQVRTHVSAAFSLDRAEAALADRFAPERTAYLLKFSPEVGIALTLFADGRVLVHGTNDVARARSIVSKYLG